jgi:endoglucanase
MPHRLSLNAGLSRRDLLKAGALGMLVAGAPHLAPLAAKAAERPGMLWGVNLAGAEFGQLLGKHGTAYTYPPPENIDYYAKLGFTLIRLPFKWERLQPQLSADFDRDELSRLAAAVSHARSLGLTVVLDPHNFAKRRLPADGWAKEYLIGSSEVPLAAFVDFWGRLADAFKGDDKIVFGLMNEPVTLDAPSWLAMANAAIAQIRESGATNMLFVPGTDYTGAHSWFSAGNTAMEGIKDPLGNVALEVHQYFDADSSGTKPDAVSSTIGSERIEAFQGWARERGFRAFLGEFCGGRDDISSRALMDLCDELIANSDVWLGCAAWAGGPWWPPDDMFNLEPYPDGRVREQTAIIRSRAVSGIERPYWAGPTPLFYVDFARNIAVGTERPLAVLRSASNGEDARDLAGLVGPRGLSIAGAPAAGPLLADGALAALFQLPEFTIVVELRDLAAEEGQQEILSAADVSLLNRTTQGEIRTGLSGMLATSPQGPDRWKHKRRCGLSFSAGSGAITIAVTGAPPVSGYLSEPAFSDPRLVRIGEGPGGALGGTICRIIGFAQFFRPGDLAKAIA